MSGHDRLHRGVLLLVGLVLLGLGVAGILAGAGALGRTLPGRPLFDNPAARYVGHGSAWFWPVAALVSLVVGGLALRWLLTHLHSERVRDLDLGTDRAGGPTHLTSGALLEAVTGEISGFRGVRRASGRLLGDDRDPRLVLVVDLNGDADVVAVRQRVEQEAVAHARASLDRADLPVRLDLRVTDASTGSRVR